MANSRSLYVFCGRLLATWFGCGLFPQGPGTIGSLAAVGIAFCLHSYAGWNGPAISLLGGALFLPGIWAASIEEQSAGRTDPGQVVIDEVAGQWITFAGALSLNWKTWLAGFLLFRLFDIVKPFPARQAEALPSGLGIMADDGVAGIYAALVLFAAGWFNLY